MQLLVHLVLVLVQVMFASLAVVGKLVYTELPAEGVVVIRVCSAALILVPVMVVAGKAKVRDRRDIFLLALLGLLGVSANQSLFLIGLSYTTAINASILVTTIPIFTVLYGVLLRQERASAGKILGIVVAGAGAVYLIGPDRVSLAPGLALGNLLVVTGMMCFAAFLVLSKRILKRYSSLTVTVYAIAFGTFGTLPLGLPALQQVDLASVSTGIWALMGYIVLVPTVAAYFLNIWALKRVSSQLVAAYIYLQPLVTVVAAPALLEGEHLTQRAALASLAIFIGLGLVIRTEARQDRGLPLAALPGE